MNDYVVSLNSKKFDVRIINPEKIQMNGKVFDIDLKRINQHSYLMIINDKPLEITFDRLDGEKYRLLIDGNYYETTVRSKLREMANEALKNRGGNSHAGVVKAPMPGLVIKLNKQIGDTVSEKDSLLVLEAMKMENDIRAVSSGIIKEIKIKEGDSVEKNQTLIVIE